MHDVIVKAPYIPRHSDAVISRFHHGPGGSAANVALNLHRMGLSVHLVGVAGADDAGDSVKRAFDREGLRASLVRRGYTPEVLCLVTLDGEPMRFSNLTDTVSLGLADIRFAWVDECCALHFEGWQLNDATTRRAWRCLASRARSKGALVSLELPHPSYIETMGVAALHEAVRQLGVDVLIANGPEAEAANLWSNAGSWAPTVVVHRGNEATRVIQSGVVRDFPLEVILAPSDTTGAGDAFTSVFIAVYARHRSIDKAVKAGHEGGRRAVQTHGAALSLSSASSLWASVSDSTAERVTTRGSERTCVGTTDGGFSSRRGAAL